MAPQWIPQNIQKRLLLYVLQQLSLFSEIDLPNLDVSLGAQSQISLRDIKLDSEKITFPGVFLRDGQIGLLELRLTVTGGVSIDASDIEIILAPAPLNNNNLHFSLVESTANLANSVMFPQNEETDYDSDQESIAETITESSNANNPEPSSNSGSALSAVMAKAAEMALARLQVNLQNIKIRIIADLTTLEIHIQKVTFNTENGIRNVQIEGLEVVLVKPDSDTGDIDNTNSNSNSNTNSESDTSIPSSDNDSDSEDMMASSILNPKNSLMESMVFSHEEASSIYMSATSDVLKSKLQNSRHLKKLPILIYIDKITAKFEGLTDLNNLAIDIGQIKVSATPIPPALVAIFGTISRLAKLNNIQKRNLKRQQQANNVDLQDDAGNFSDFFTRLHIDKIIVSLTAALSSNGEFASTKSINLSFANIKIKKKDETLTYGGIESVQLIKNENEVIFEFEDNSEPDDIKKKADIRFEMLFQENNETTLLCSKPGFLKLDTVSLSSILSLLQKLSPAIAAFKKISIVGNNIEPFKHSKASQLIIQTAVFNVQLKLNESHTLKATILPISFNLLQGSLSIKKVLVSLLHSSAEKLIMKISNINLSSQSKEFKSFDAHNREVTLTSPLTVDFSSVKLTATLQEMRNLTDSLISFNQTLSKNENKVKSQPYSKRKVRMGSTVFQNQQPISMRINLKQFLFDISDINDKFGSFSGGLDLIGMDFMKDGDIQLLAMNGSCGRQFLGTAESFIEMANPEDKSSPIVSIKIRRSSIIDISLKNLVFEYHTNWIPLFENDAAEVSQELSEEIEKTSSKKLDIRVSLAECVLGLNAHHLTSKGLLAIKKANADIIISKEISIKADFRTVNLLLIDDSSNILTIDESRDRRNWVNMKRQDESIPTWSQVSWFISRGFASVANVNSFHTDIIINNVTNLKKLPGKEKSLIDIKMNSETWKLSLCADSAQVLTQMINDLKQPIIIKHEDRYQPALNTDINVFNGVDQEAFRYQSKPASSKPSSQHSNSSSIKFIDSFYESSGSGKSSSSSMSGSKLSKVIENDDDGADRLLDQDLNELNISINSTKKNVGESKNPFYFDRSILKSSDEEQGPNIVFEDDHFEQNSTANDSEEAKIYPLKLYFMAAKIVIDLFDGYDWKETRRTISNVVKRVEAQAVKELQKLDHESFEIPRQLPISKSKRRDSLGERGFIDHNEEWEFEDDEETDFNYNNRIIGETIYDSIHVSIPIGVDPSNLTKNINRGLNNIDESDKGSVNSNAGESHGIELGKNYKRLKLKRSKYHKVSIEINDIDVEVVILNNIDPRKSCPAKASISSDYDDSEILNLIDVRVRDLQITDNVPTSTWNKFLSYMRSAGEREVGVNMLHLNLKTVRPNPSLCATEIIMNVQLLPLRLYVDQDTLDFLTRFGAFKDSRFQLPVLEDDDIIFIQKFNINSFKVKLDYKPKTVDYSGIRSGHTTEFMNFFILDEADMTMKNLTIYGISGFSKLGKLLNDIWMPDIKSTQLGGILAGLAPVRSIVNIGSGMKDLIAIPIKEYKKDGRIMRSLQKGLSSFAKTTSNEILKFGVKLANGTQTILETTEEALGGDGSSARISENLLDSNIPIFYNRDDEEFYAIVEETKQNKQIHKSKQAGMMNSSQLIGRGSLSTGTFNRRGFKSDLQSFMEDDEDEDDYLNKEDSSTTIDKIENDESQKTISLYANQPENIKEGLSSAYSSFGKNLVTAQKAIKKASSNASESGSAQGTAIAIAKATPVVVIRPIIGATEAMSRALLGFTNYLDPEQRINAQDKYKPIPKK